MSGLLGEIITETWLLNARMAPWLLLGFLVAGVLSAFISPVWLERHLGGRGLGPVFRASLFGVPLPLCSCGVIPVAASLKQHGASRSATTAFLLSTPQTGIDSILVTWTMLGPFFALFRPVAALATGVLGGGLVQLLDPPVRSDAAIRGELAAHAAGSPSLPVGRAARVAAALKYGFLTLPADIGRALLVGILVAGVLAAAIPGDFLAGYLGAGPLSIALMMVVGIPVYVCATASVPLAAGFIFLGASPGAALAFLIAGPATNAATLTTVGRVLGRRTAAIYLATVAVSAFGGGLLLDWLLPRAGEWVPLLAGGGHHHEAATWFEHLTGAALVLVMTVSWWSVRRKDSSCGCRDEACAADPETARLEFAIAGMNCSHCVRSVEEAVLAVSGVDDCRASVAEGRLTVTGSGADPQAIVAAVRGLGYRADLRSTEGSGHGRQK